MKPPRSKYWSYGMKGFGILVLGGVVGFFIGSTIEFFRNIDKDHHFEDLES
jgi:hypothetical protein